MKTVMTITDSIKCILFIANLCDQFAGKMTSVWSAQYGLTSKTKLTYKYSQRKKIYILLLQTTKGKLRGRLTNQCLENVLFQKIGILDA